MIIDQKGQKILFVHSFNSDEEMREQLSEWYPCCKILSLARFNNYDKQRNFWPISPITRVKQSRKIYKRKGRKKNEKTF